MASKNALLKIPEYEDYKQISSNAKSVYHFNITSIK